MASFLLADDLDSKRTALRHFVERWDIDVDILEARTTEEAKRLIDDHDDIAYAFIDYEMPSECGPAVIAYLREKQPTAKIALVTSGSSDRYRNDGFNAGADEFVCTSLDQQTVERRLTDVLELWKHTS